MEINELIKKISPLYNTYRENKLSISGTEALEIMWDIGDVLIKYIEENEIPPHRLFWSIYGNAEGKVNIGKKSYITREFQNRCHRIRKIFKNKDQIRVELPFLTSFTTFREAMPFFDNAKYKLIGAERDDLLSLLNSKQQPRIILEKIKQLQRERIGINNPRTQRLHELKKEGEIFATFFNYIWQLTKKSSYKLCSEEIDDVSPEFIKILSKNISAMSQEGLKFYNFETPKELNTPWKEFSELLNALISQKDARTRRRFRRIISVSKISRLADMLYALLSEERYESFRR